MRAFSEIQYRSLRTICTAAYDAVGGHTLFAKMRRSRVSVSQLSKYASTNETEGDDAQPLFMPIDVAVDIDFAVVAMGEQPIIVGQMAELLGFRLTPAPGGSAPRRKVDEAMAQELMLETTDVFRAILEALRDKHVDGRDRKTILKEAHEARRALEMVIGGLEADAS